MGVLYATDVDVKLSAEITASANADAQIVRALESASRSIDGRRPGGGRLHRRFYPEVATRYFSVPATSVTPASLLLGRYELISATSVISGGTTIAPSTGYLLGPRNDGPPYDRIDLVKTAYSAWPGGSGQDAIAVNGVWGYDLTEAAAGTVTEVLDASETDVEVSSCRNIGVGTILRVDAERMIVTMRSLFTTGQTLQVPLTAFMDDQSVTVTNGTLYASGETITLDSETMLITAISGNTLIVTRAWDGSGLDPHTGSTIFAPRLLTVERGALGTTAATHLISAPLFRHVLPPLVVSLCVAEAVAILEQEGSGYARTVTTQEAGGGVPLGRGIADIRADAEQAYRRRTTWLGV